MAVTNQERVGKGLDLLKGGLGPFVDREFKSAYNDRAAAEASRFMDDVRLNTQRPIADWDAAALLKLMWVSWNDIFRKTLGHAERSLVSELRDHRNKWAHQQNFSGDEAYRALDSAGRLLTAVSAPQADEIEKMKMELLRLRFGEITGATPLPHDPVQPPVTPPPINPPVAPPQTQADRVRQFACDHYIGPARRDGLVKVIIRAGDVHRDIGLSNAMPAVCSAIGGNRFAQMANVTLAERTGPPNGSNVYFRFTLGAQPRSAHWTAVTPRPEPKTAPPAKTNALDLDGALVLISCVKSKLAHPAPARGLYTSAWFRGVRDIVETRGARWLLLSSLYGLVAPDAVIAPYDYTLNSLGVAERQVWANKVLEKLLPEAAGFHRIVMFAGVRYREFLIGPLQRRGIVVDIPMENLTRGEQLAWLTQHR
jgi:hypothetical protein